MSIATEPTLPLAPDLAAGRELSDAEQDYLFDLNGYLILRDVISPDQLQRINAWVDAQDRPNLETGDWVGDCEVHTYEGTDGINFQNAVAADEPAFQELIDNPKWVGQVRRYIETGDHTLSMDETFLNVRQGGGFIPSDDFIGKLTDAQKQIIQPIAPKGRPGRTITFERGGGVGV
jgi:hypothetical protein